MKTKIMVRNHFYTLMPIIFWISVFLPPLIFAVMVGVNSPSSAMGSFVAGLLTFLGTTLIFWLLGIVGFGLIFSFLDVADRIESIERMLAKNLKAPPVQAANSGESDDSGGGGDNWSPM